MVVSIVPPIGGIGDYMLPIPPVKGTSSPPGHGMAALGRKSSSGARGPNGGGDQNLFSGKIMVGKSDGVRLGSLKREAKQLDNWW